MSMIRQIIDLWPSRSELARDIGVEPSTVRQWYHRGSIPSDYWSPIAESAEERRIPVWIESLARASAAKRADATNEVAA